jgi:hypothetical protein
MAMILPRVFAAAAALAAIAGAGATMLRGAKPERHFQTSDRCMACHNSLFTPSGEDVSIGIGWRASMMANSARDPYWQAGVRREILDHPESKALIEDECAICHMPMARYQAHTENREAEVFTHLPFDPDNQEDLLAADGVSCSLCHQIAPDKLGTRESLVGRFVIDTSKPKGQRNEYGPYQVDAGHQTIMRSSSGGWQPAEGEHIRRSELCATCHTLITTALGPNGETIGSLPEQVPYQEWLHSEFRETRSCQSCHMPAVQEPTPITRVLGEPREGLARHVFVGGNFFIQRVLNRFRGELSVAAYPQELETAAARTVAHLESQTARVTVTGAAVRNGRLEAEVLVENLGGHKLPTAYPSRRAWLHVTVTDASGAVLFESGKLEPSGRIVGNDNDADPLRYEPHYTQIESPDQVQIYEGIVVDRNGRPTTGLLSAVRYEKDNRLLPRGFDKATAEEEIAVQGAARADADFAGGGDRVRYLIPVTAQGPLRVEAELWFQPISYRWAENLKPYDAFEPRRFVRYYEAMSEGSGVRLAAAAAVAVPAAQR